MLCTLCAPTVSPNFGFFSRCLSQLLLHKDCTENSDAMEVDDDDIQRLDNERAQYLGGDDTLYELMQHGVGYVSVWRDIWWGVFDGGYLTGDL